jgi:hypothetical protein
MKKFILGCLLLITACQPAATATQAPSESLFPTATVLPTPIPFTETPAPTPTLEASPTPFPQFFTNEFDSALAGWAILQAGNDAVPNVKVENSRLSLEIDSNFTWVYALYGAQDYDSAHVDTKFVNNAMSPASIGLICNYTDENGWFEYNVNTDGTYNVLYGKWLSTGVADYLPVLDGSSGLIQQSGAEQQIGLICSNGILTLTINDQIIRNVDVSHYGLTGGKVGLTASSYENTPVIASFDWVKVTPSVTP